MFEENNKKEKIVFIGSIDFKTGGFGGETLKNNYFIEYLKKKEINLEILDIELIKKNKFLLVLLLIKAALNPKIKKVIISKADHGANIIIKIFNRLNFFKKEIHYFVIGGKIHTRIKDNYFDKKEYICLKKIYVESKEMKKTLEEYNVSNVEYLPNFKDFKIRKYKKKKIQKPLKCVFFSRIIPEKGVDMIFDALKNINIKNVEMNVDFYGPISNEYESKFFENLENENTATYKGILNIQDEKTFDILSEYDLMLFPTYWEGEGFPGTLIDSFIAGIPILASEWNYNSEIITEDTGYLFEAQNQEEFLKMLKNIFNDLDGLTNKRKQCLEEAKKYHVDNVLKKFNKEQLGIRG